jgi:hypothetical protein
MSLFSPFVFDQLPNNLFPDAEQQFVACLQLLGLNYSSPFTAKNAQYTSPRFVTEAIFAMSAILKQEQVERLQSSKFSSVMVDETTDIAVTSQLSIFVRYAHEQKIVEEFFGLVHLKGALTFQF